MKTIAMVTIATTRKQTRKMIKGIRPMKTQLKQDPDCTENAGCANDAPVSLKSKYLGSLLASITPFSFPGMVIATTREQTKEND